SDTAFSPVILKAQNSGSVSLTVKNTGAKAHDFVVQCLAVNGCTACFPDAAKIPPLQPGASAIVTFTAPEEEGIYAFTSDVPGDMFAGQFILQ
ncbi:MAG: CARDB domain-containing protein, partial [Polyangiaceae bacterium]